MASAWGSSWGSSWGDSWGSIEQQPFLGRIASLGLTTRVSVHNNSAIAVRGAHAQASVIVAGDAISEPARTDASVRSGKARTVIDAYSKRRP